MLPHPRTQHVSLSKAIEIDPVDALSYTHLAGVMEKLERFEDAAAGNECKETDRCNDAVVSTNGCWCGEGFCRQW